MKSIIGRKIGMTSVFAENGSAIPVSVIEVLPNVVLQKKTKEKDGYEALQVGYEDKKPSRATKAELGLAKKANTVPHYYWLWDSGSNTYRNAQSLQGASVDAQAQEVVSQYHYENGVDYTDYYAPDDSGNLVLVRREIADWTQGDGQAPVVSVYPVKNGELTLTVKSKGLKTEKIKITVHD